MVRAAARPHDLADDTRRLQTGLATESAVHDPAQLQSSRSIQTKPDTNNHVHRVYPSAADRALFTARRPAPPNHAATMPPVPASHGGMAGPSNFDKRKSLPGRSRGSSWRAYANASQ